MKRTLTLIAALALSGCTANGGSGIYAVTSGLGAVNSAMSMGASTVTTLSRITGSPASKPGYQGVPY